MLYHHFIRKKLFSIHTIEGFPGVTVKRTPLCGQGREL